MPYNIIYKMPSGPEMSLVQVNYFDNDYYLIC